MKILLCPDKFKGSLSATEVCQALDQGLRQNYPGAEIIHCPLADGGDGSLSVLERYLDLETVTVAVQDPLGRPIEAKYRRNDEKAYIELAAASGLVLLRPEERHCIKASSYGTGLLLAHAIRNGVRELYLFIGGSASNDGGLGIAEALGYRFYNSRGERLLPIGEHLLYIEHIDASGIVFDPAKLSVKVVCDVDNPLYGPNGAAYTYAPQKGATPEEVATLDRGLAHLAARLRDQLGVDICELPGAGAAGGIGGGAVAFLQAQLYSGTAVFMEISRLAQHIEQADIVITGEGNLDAQTEQGKLISGVCRLAQRSGKPVIAVCGAAQAGVAGALGLYSVYTILQRSSSLAEAMERAAEKLVEIGLEMELV